MNAATEIKTAPLAPTVQETRETNTFLGLGIAEWFILSQILLPGILFLPGTQSIRVIIRTLPFVISLFLYFKSAKEGHTNIGGVPPSTRWIVWGLIYMLLMIAHPNTNTLLAGAAQVVLYAAICAPILWAGSFVTNWSHFSRLLFLCLIINSLNCAFGLLQVWDSRFLPTEFTSVYASQIKQGYLTFKGANGMMVRPPGLSDTPGAVAFSGIVSILLGLVFLCEGKGNWLRLFSLASIPVGFAAILVSHVRSSLVLSLIGIAAYVALLVIKRKSVALITLIATAVSTIAVIGMYITFLGGKATMDRFESLTADSTTNVYHSSRGAQLSSQLENYSTEYPFGAGLGRWGMMHVYFGNKNSENAGPLWAEMQFPAWILDGGIIVLVCFFVAVILPFFLLARAIFTDGSHSVQIHATFLFMFTFCGLMFSWVPFTCQLGLLYWFLAGAIYSLSNRPGESNEEPS